MTRLSMPHHRVFRSRHLGLRFALMLGLLCLGLPAAAQQQEAPQPAQPQNQPQQPGQADPPRQGALRVGIYNPETVFNAYPGRETFVQQMQQLQGEALQAQQEGNEERLAQLQQQAAQAQQQVLSQFEAQVQAALPEVAREAGVQLVVVEVAYSDPPVQTQDITPMLVQRIAPQQPAGPAEPAAPNATPQQGTEQPQPQQAPPAPAPSEE